MTELLFNTTILTDMGCTFRLFRREAIDLIRASLTIGGSHFGPQLLMEVVAHGIQFVEIPINYRPRVGKSSVMGSFWKAFVPGIQMIVLVLQYRFGLYRKQRTSRTEQETILLQSASTNTKGLSALAESIKSEETLISPVRRRN